MIPDYGVCESMSTALSVGAICARESMGRSFTVCVGGGRRRREEAGGHCLLSLIWAGSCRKAYLFMVKDSQNQRPKMNESANLSVRLPDLNNNRAN
jgi:hypothetical protein